MNDDFTISGTISAEEAERFRKQHNLEYSSKIVKSIRTCCAGMLLRRHMRYLLEAFETHYDCFSYKEVKGFLVSDFIISIEDTRANIDGIENELARHLEEYN